MPPDAFIAFFSYSREDSEFALRLANDLKAAGSAVWIDQLDIGPGKRWDSEVQSALENCPSVLLILSPASVSSNNVMDEVSFALDQQKTLIPVLYRDCDIPFRVRRFQHLDFRSDYDRMLQELRNCLHIGGQAEPPATSANPTAPPPADAPASPSGTRQSTVERIAPPAPAPVQRSETPSYSAAESTSSSFPAWAKIAIPVALIVIAVIVYMVAGSGSKKDDRQNQPVISNDAGGSPGTANNGRRAGAAAFDLVGTALAHAQTSPACSLPSSSDSDFTASNPEAWFFFAYRGGSAADQWSVDWVRPNGAVYKTDTVAHVDAGNARYCFAMKIAGTKAQKMQGEWSVRLNRNGTQVAQSTFRIVK